MLFFLMCFGFYVLLNQIDIKNITYKKIDAENKTKLNTRFLWLDVLKKLRFLQLFIYTHL